MNSCCYALERDRGHSSHRRFCQRVAARCIAGADLPVAGMRKEGQLNLVQGSEVLVIVSSLCQGDDGDDVMWMQHDVYNEALGIISGTCLEYINLDHRMLDDDQPKWEIITGYDHCTLQHFGFPLISPTFIRRAPLLIPSPA